MERKVQANRRLLKNVFGFLHLTASMIYTIFTGINVDIAFVKIIEEADHVKTSIWPGMSTKNVFYFFYSIFLAIALTMFSGWAAKRFRAVRMAPLGPSFCWSMTWEIISNVLFYSHACLWYQGKVNSQYVWPLGQDWCTEHWNTCYWVSSWG